MLASLVAKGGKRRGYTGSITTNTKVATRTKTTRQSLPRPPPLIQLPQQPHHRCQNCCPRGECYVRREFNAPGECSVHAKAAIAVGAPTPTAAIAITSGQSSHLRLHLLLRPQPPPESRRLRLIRQTLLSRRSQQCYYSWGSGESWKGARGGVTAGGNSRHLEASAGTILSGGGVTRGAAPWRGDRCRGRRGKCGSPSRAREQA